MLRHTSTVPAPHCDMQTLPLCTCTTSAPQLKAMGRPVARLHRGDSTLQACECGAEGSCWQCLCTHPSRRPHCAKSPAMPASIIQSVAIFAWSQSAPSTACRDTTIHVHVCVRCTLFSHTLLPMLVSVPSSHHLQQNC